MVKIDHYCSWCKEFQFSEERDDFSEDTKTHGMCEKCEKDLLKNELPKTKERLEKAEGNEVLSSLITEKIEKMENRLKELENISINEASDSVSPKALMRLSQINDPDELLKDYNKDNIIIEDKLDGWKAQAIKSNGEVKLYSRRGDEKTDNFPELIGGLKSLPDGTLVEGELVYWNNNKQDIGKVTSIAGSNSDKAIEKMKELPGKIKLHLYDILWYKGNNITKKPFSERRKILQNIIKPTDTILITKQYPFSKWENVMNNAVKSGGEGIVLKLKDQPYEYKEKGENEPKPSGIMFKYKGGVGKSDSDDYVVYDCETTDKGNLKALFGQYYEGKLYHISDIGNFSEENEKIIKDKLKKGKFVIEIGFQERVPGGLRHQKFVRFRDDKKPQDATMNEFHSKNIDNFKVVKAMNSFKLSKRAEALTPDKLLIELKSQVKVNPIHVREPKVPASLNFDPELGFKIMSKLESNNKSWIRGDSGNSFGLTQVHGPYFMKWLSKNPKLEQATGIDPKKLEELSNEWKKNMRNIRKENIWKNVPVDKNSVEEFIKQNPNKVVKRREGTSIKMNPRGNVPGIVKKIGNRYIGKEFDIDLLENKYGFKPTPNNLLRLQNVADTYITPSVAKSALAQLITSMEHPDTSAKFYRSFSSKSVRNNSSLKNLSDWVSKSDFMNKMRMLVSDVIKYEYNPNVPGAYNMYQLMAIANGSGPYRVRRFLSSRKPFGPAHVHYLQRANGVIQKMTGLPTNIIEGGLAGFQDKRYAFLINAESFPEEEPTQADPLKGFNAKYLPQMLKEFEWYKEHLNEIIEDFKTRYEKDFTEEEVVKAITNTIINKYKNLASEAKLRNILVKCAQYTENGTIYFPDQYAEDIKSGKRTYTIRPGDVNVNPDDKVKCKSYSGANIADIKIITKRVMSITRINKAYGERMAKSLEDRFGPDKRFVIIEFEPINISSADDDKEKMSEVLIDKDKKLTRGEIRKHYEKPEVRKKIMSRIKGKPVLIYLGVGKNKTILKRNHNDKEIVITNDNPNNDENPNNYFYWVKRRLLSFHQVFGNKTDLGFVDLDIHGNYPLEKAKKYARELSSKLKEKYGTTPTIFQSGGSGIHVEFKLKSEISIDKLREELKDLLTNLNEKWEDVTTGVVKGSGMRSDVSTLHNKGSIRVPESFGENNGNIKKILGGEQDTAENNYNNAPLHENKYDYGDIPFPEGNIIQVAPSQGQEPYSQQGAYNAADDFISKKAYLKASKINKEYIWLWDEINNKFTYHLNINNGKREKQYFGHIELAQHNNIKQITNEGWRGRIFIYKGDEPADIQFYGEKNLQDLPNVVKKGFNNILQENEIKNFQFEQIDWPSSEWKADAWKSNEKERQLEKHMEKRRWMGFDEPDPEFIEMLNAKFAQIAILVPPTGCSEKEYLITQNIFINKYGFKSHIISTFNVVEGVEGTLINSKKIKDINTKQYDALIVCGGEDVCNFSKNKEVKDLLKSFVKQNKPIGMINNAVLLGAESNIISGLKITGNPDVVGKVKRANGIWTGLPVEKSGNIFTSIKDQTENLIHIISNNLLKTSVKKSPINLEQLWKIAESQDDEEVKKFLEQNPEFQEEEPEEIETEQEKLDKFIESVPEKKQEEVEKKQEEVEKKQEEVLKKKRPEYFGFKQVVKPEEIEEVEEKKDVDFSDLLGDEEKEDLWGEALSEYKEEEEDEEEDTKEKIPIFGEKLEPPRDKDGVVLSRWFNSEEIKRPVMSANAKDLFSPDNMKDGPSLTKLFQDPYAWEELKKNPEIAQKWVLPAIIMGVGKKWFDNNSSQLKLGRKGDVGSMPFGMFDQGDIDLLIKGIPITDLPSSKAYISLINEAITDLANTYFSFGYRVDPPRGSVPLGGYIYKSLSRRISKIIAQDKGYKEVRIPVCAYCKSRKQKRQSKDVFYNAMVPSKEKGPVKRWYCEDCKRVYEENKDKITKLENYVSRKQNDVFKLQEKLNEVIEQLGENQTPELEDKKRKYEQSIISLSTDIRHSKLDLNNLEKKQYSLQVQSEPVPYWHTWCPNSGCPGNRVPMTALDRNHEFWKTEAGAKAIVVLQKRFGIVVGSSQSAEDESLPNILPQRIPPDELLDVPFICPHDYVKFTLRSARGKGLNRKGGYFWEPWQHMKWDQVGKEEFGVEEEEGLGGIEADQEANMRQNLTQKTMMYLSVLGAKIFNDQHKIAINSYNDWFSKQIDIQRNFGKPITEIVKKIEKSKINGSKQRVLSMYETLGETSHLDPGMFISWLGDININSGFIADKDGNIEQKNITEKITTKDKVDNVYIPALHSWVSKMMESRDDWFEYYHMEDILSDQKIDGIYGNGPGTFFITKIGDQISEDDLSFGFKCNLVPAHHESTSYNPYRSYKPPSGSDFSLPRSNPKKQPLRSHTSIRPKVLKFIGLWKIPPGYMKFITNPNWVNGTAPVPLNNKLVEYAKRNPNENLSGEIMYSDFYHVALNNDDTSFGIGEYALVQALIMPGKYNPEPVVNIRNIRNKSDTHHQIFSKVGALMNQKDIDPESEALLREFFEDIQNYGDDPEEMLIYMEDLVRGFEELKKKSSFKLSKRADSLSKYKKKRNFDETPEPEGKLEEKNKHRFVIQNHKALKAGNHYDLRLENDEGSMSSWAVPKHKLPNGKERLLAVKTENHPISYNKFEGKIEKGNYGSGDVKIHDSGTYEEISSTKNKIVFKLNGKKEKGTYNLFKTDGNKWMIMEYKESNADFKLSKRAGQTYTSDSGEWSVDMLIELTENIKPEDVSVNSLEWNMDHNAWGKNITPKIVLDNPKKYKEEFKRIKEVSLNYPILLYKGKLIDGYHRLSKAVFQNKKNIKAIILNKKQMDASRIDKERRKDLE